MKNIRFVTPISKPLFRFGQKLHNQTGLSTHTSWTTLTKTTTTCLYEFKTQE